MKRRKILTSLVMVLICIFSFSANQINASASSYSGSAQAMVLIEKESGRVLNEKNADTRLPMASTTKIVTAITVIENVDNLDEVVKIPSSAVGVEGSSIYLGENESLSYRQLLYGLMLRSGNDCAVALALSVSKSVQEFACLMNETAKKAGAKNSNFVNPHGLHDKNHYTTARDLGKISAYAMKNEEFAKIVSTKRITIPWEGKEYDRDLVNKNKILTMLDGGDGIKTGYTTVAGRCLVASATRNGMTLIAVVLNCRPMFEDCATLLEDAFAQYCPFNLTDFALSKVTVPVSNGKEKSVTLGLNRKIIFPLTENEKNELKISTVEVKNMKAPVKKGEENGKIRILSGNRLLFEEKLYTISSVEVLSVADRLSQIIAEWA